MALITLGANAITALPSGVGGKVLQVVTATDDNTKKYNINFICYRFKYFISINNSKLLLLIKYFN
jgi:hypothetical protein